MDRCESFDSGYSLIRNRNTRNMNDKMGDTLIIAVIIVLISSIITIVLFNTAKQRYWLPFLVLSIILVLIVISWVIYNPAVIPYAGSSCISRKTRTNAVLNPYKVFPGASEFEKNYKKIKSEISAMGTNGFVDTDTTYKSQNAIIGRDSNEKGEKWRILTISVGNSIPKSLEIRLPTLCKLIRKHRSHVLSCVISVLPPGVMIPQHVGYYKGVVRYMLGIKIPKKRHQCYLCVNDNKIVWEEGKSIAFDDTYPHKVFNKSEESRVVIYMDILRPGITGLASWANKGMIYMMQNSGIVKDEIARTEKTVSLKQTTKM